MSAPQTAATANGAPRTPISFERLTTPPSPKLPPVGALIHAYHCKTPNCNIGSCAQTKQLISRIARHVQTCAHKRTPTPGRAHPTRNTCKLCRLNEALNASEGHDALIQRATLAAQLSSPVRSFSDINLRTMHPSTVTSWCTLHYDACPESNKGNCLLCKKLREFAIAGLKQRLQANLNHNPNFVQSLLGDSSADASSSNGPSNGPDSSDDDVQIVGSSTLEERNKRGFANAFDLEDETNSAAQPNEPNESKAKKQHKASTPSHTYNLRKNRK